MVNPNRISIGREFVVCNGTIGNNHPLKSWYVDPNLNGIPNHESRSHVTQDLMRYMLVGLYIEKYGIFPRLQYYATHHSDFIPDHANVKSVKFTEHNCKLT